VPMDAHLVCRLICHVPMGDHLDHDGMTTVGLGYCDVKADGDLGCCDHDCDSQTTGHDAHGVQDEMRRFRRWPRHRQQCRLRSSSRMMTGPLPAMLPCLSPDPEREGKIGDAFDLLRRQPSIKARNTDGEPKSRRFLILYRESPARTTSIDHTEHARKRCFPARSVDGALPTLFFDAKTQWCRGTQRKQNLGPQKTRGRIVDLAELSRQVRAVPSFLRESQEAGSFLDRDTLAPNLESCGSPEFDFFALLCNLASLRRKERLPSGECTRQLMEQSRCPA
jgi:hypothetical protein